MRIHLRIRDLPYDPDLLEYVDHRARFALGRFSPRIPSLYVTVGDDDGPCGGIDKSCRATARIHGRPSVTVTSLDASPRDAVDRALGRLGRAVQRVLDVRRETQTGRRTRPLDEATFQRIVRARERGAQEA